MTDCRERHLAGLAGFTRGTWLASRFTAGSRGRLTRPVGAVELLGGAGGVLNGARLPERMAPGRFDRWANSHQVRTAARPHGRTVLMGAGQVACRAPACLPTYLPACLPAYLPTYMPACLPTYMPACHSTRSGACSSAGPSPSQIVCGAAAGLGMVTWAGDARAHCGGAAVRVLWRRRRPRLVAGPHLLHAGLTRELKEY